MSWTNRKGRRTKLTEEEIATLQSVCDKWNRIGLSTAPSNRQEAEQGAVELYLAMGLKAPEKFYWFDSIAAYVNNHRIRFTATGTPDRDFNSHLWKLNFLDREPRKGVFKVFTSAPIHSVERAIDESVLSQWSIHQVSLALYVASGVDPEDIQPAGFPCYGQNDTAWLALVDFFSTVKCIGPHQTLTSLMRIVASCGYFVPGEKREYVGFFERPSIIRLDDRRRPHCLDGPAIQYRDGFGVFAIHGVPVPRKYIETPAEQISIEELLREKDAEVRTAVFSKVGFVKLLNSTPHKIISQANGNSLVEFEIGYDKVRALHLKWVDKTGPKETVIPVPRHREEFGPDCPDEHKRIINDCEQVRRWTLGWPKDVEILAET